MKRLILILVTIFAILFGAPLIYSLIWRDVERVKQQTPCFTNGYTKIEKGVGVTNCGDTVKIFEYSDKTLNK